MIAVLILAGGRGARIGGDKAALELDGIPLLQWVIGAVEPVARDVILAIAPGQQLPAIRCDAPTSVCEDTLPDRGPLAGILAGIDATDSDHVLVVSCDAPFLQPALLTTLWSQRLGYDAVVPVVNGRPQTLVAVYARTCSEPIDRALHTDDRSIRGLLSQLNVRYINERELRSVDPDLRSFINVNTPAQLENARAHVAARVRRLEHTKDGEAG